MRIFQKHAVATSQEERRLWTRRQRSIHCSHVMENDKPITVQGAMSLREKNKQASEDIRAFIQRIKESILCVMKKRQSFG